MKDENHFLYKINRAETIYDLRASASSDGAPVDRSNSVQPSASANLPATSGWSDSEFDGGSDGGFEDAGATDENYGFDI